MDRLLETTFEARDSDFLREELLSPSPPPDPPEGMYCVCPKGPSTKPLDMVIAGYIGARLGALFVAAKGITSVGVLAKGGAGIGAPAGPVGMALGAVAGVALYGLYSAFTDTD